MDQKSRSMTMEEILNSSQETLVPVQIAAVLGYNPHSIRVQAKKDPTALGFPIIKIGTRIRIPRRPFIEFILGRHQIENVR